MLLDARGTRCTRRPLDNANSVPMAGRDAIYQEIIALARGRVLKASLRSDRRRMEVEKAHLKAIPRLLRCGDERRHRHYLRVERPRLVRACGPDTTAEFEPLWAELEQIATLHEAPAPAPAEVPMARLAGPVRLGYAGPRGTAGPGLA